MKTLALFALTVAWFNKIYASWNEYSSVSDLEMAIGVGLSLLTLNRFHIMRYLKRFIHVTLFIAVVYRLWKAPGSSSSHSLLSGLQRYIQESENEVVLSTREFKIYITPFIAFVLGDLVGLAALYGVYSAIANLVKLSDDIPTWDALSKAAKGAGFSLVKDLPMVVKQMEEEGRKMEMQLEEDIKVASRKIGMANVTLPRHGMAHRSILQLMKTETSKEDVIWKDGKVSGAVYHGVDSHRELLNQAFSMYSISNPLHPDIWPSGMKFESEIIQMVASMMDGRHGSTDGLSEDFYRHNSDVCGCTTSGGTESIILAIKAHRDYYRDVKGITKPEMIACTSAHAAVNKACDMLGIKLVQVPMDVSESTTYSSAAGRSSVGGYRMSIKATIDAINMNTIMVYSSAPTYPQGVIDDIPTLSRIAVAYDIGLHVDCCLGGFVLPFAKLLQREGARPPSVSEKMPSQTKRGTRSRSRSRGRGATPDTTEEANRSETADYYYGQNIPDFDFGLRGVSSMSVDTHKFGFALKGASVVLYGRKALRQAQYFCYADWTGGMYTTPTIAGSRSGGLIAQCWASMMALGEQGYRNHTKEILDTTHKILRGCQKIPNIKVLGDSAAMIVCFASEDESVVNTYTVSDLMNKKFGWSLNTLQNPACVHICCTVRHVNREEEFLSDLRDSVESARLSIARGEKTEGKAAIYGMTSGMPTGPINELLKVYNDVVLKI